MLAIVSINSDGDNNYTIQHKTLWQIQYCMKIGQENFGG